MKLSRTPLPTTSLSGHPAPAIILSLLDHHGGCPTGPSPSTAARSDAAKTQVRSLQVTSVQYPGGATSLTNGPQGPATPTSLWLVATPDSLLFFLECPKEGPASRPLRFLPLPARTFFPAIPASSLPSSACQMPSCRRGQSVLSCIE